MAAAQSVKLSTQQAGAISSGLSQNTHNIWLGLIGELIGVAVLAVLADLDENIGKLMVVMMVGWFIVFLSMNAAFIQTIVPGSKTSSASIYQYGSKLAGPAQ